MIVKIHSRGAGSGSGPVDYLLGKERNREQADVLRGDPERVKELIDTSEYTRTYTSGVLSFQERDLPDAEKTRLMDEWENTLMTGLDKDQYTCLWVQHQDKGRLELNFVIPNVELQSGKRLQPYFDRADRPRVNAWQTLTNERLGLRDPNDPIYRRPLTPASDLPRDKQLAAESITKGLTELMRVGQIRERKDVVSHLEQFGFQVVRETKNSLSIADPSGGRNIRLKGAIYERDFKFGETVRDDIEAASRRYRNQRQHRISAARECYQTGLEIKRTEHQQRYPRTEPTAALVVGYDDGQTQSVDRVIRSLSDCDTVRHSGVSGQDDSRPLSGNSAVRSERAGDERIHRERAFGNDGRQEEKPVLPDFAEIRVQRGHTVSEPERSYCHQISDQIIPLNVSDNDTAAFSQRRNPSYDGNRETAPERTGELTAQLRTTAERMAEQLRQLTEHVRHYLESLHAKSAGKRPAERASDTLTATSRGLEQASHQFERNASPVIAVAEHKRAEQRRTEREQQRQQQKTRSRDDDFGMSM